MMAFTFDLEDVCQALSACRRRGCSVMVLLDRRQAMGKSTRNMTQQVTALVANGVSVRVKAGRDWKQADGATFGRGMMHAKVLRADERIVIGSTNCTSNSQTCVETAVEVQLSPQGAVTWNRRFEKEWAGACPFADALEHPRKSQGSRRSATRSASS